VAPRPDDDPRPQRSSGDLVLPRTEAAPLRAVVLRVVVGIAVLVAMAFVVWLDRDGYTDIDGEVSFRDALYYATVSLSTTGYGDIAPITPRSRLVNILLVTPLRVLFVLVLVGTTVEVLTRRSRNEYRLGRWRSGLADHTVVIGYGTKGRAAVKALVEGGRDTSQIVVVEDDDEHLQRALKDRLSAVAGDGTRDDVLRQAGVDQAARVIVALNEDASAVLSTLSVRRLAPQARIVAAVRESGNAQVLRDSGAHSVVLSSEAAGRLLGVSLTSPTTGRVLEDLIVPGQGLELKDRAVRPGEVGQPAHRSEDLVVAVVRDGVRLPGPARLTVLEEGDVLVVVSDTRRRE
jgi:voltage-gated potassium channel